MRIGIFDHIERRDDVDTARQYEERLQLVELYDRAGFYCYHVAEHHHSALCLAPNQFVYLAAVAQRTKNLRLATAVSVLPLHNPIRLAEEICMLDHLSNGRAEVGIGRGTDRAQELRMWGGDATENDQLFEESLAVLLGGLQNEFLSYQGRFFNLKDLWMELRPKQQPLPPLWWPGNAQHAGENGMNFIGGERTDIAGIAALMQQYRDAYAASLTPHHAGRAEPLFGANKRVLIMDSDEQAIERARASWAVYRTHFHKPLPGGGVDPAEIPGPAKIDFDTALAAGALLVGTVNKVRAFMEQYTAESTANYFVGSFQWGNLSHAEAMRSAEAFASEIMPAIGATAIV